MDCNELRRLAAVEVKYGKGDRDIAGGLPKMEGRQKIIRVSVGLYVPCEQQKLPGRIENKDGGFAENKTLCRTRIR